jgi:hypothetical protein
MRGLKLMSYAVLAVEELKNIVYHAKLMIFFRRLEENVNNSLTMNIVKPDVLVTTKDTEFKYIDLYSLMDSSISKVDINDRISFYKSIKHHIVYAKKCFYTIVNYHGKQPLIFTVWIIGDEIKLGVFILNDMNTSFNVDNLLLKDTVEQYFKLMKSPLFSYRFDSSERNYYTLHEMVLTNISNKDGMINSPGVAEMIQNLYGTFITQIILKFYESIIDKDKEYIYKRVEEEK